jgi:DNA-binding response OmpR family regulator
MQTRVADTQFLNHKGGTMAAPEHDRKTILVIDDEEEIRDYLRFALEKAGYTVVEAGDGNQGLDAFGRCKVDLVITDLVMPAREGVETIRELVVNHPDVRIIAMSGATGGETYLNLVSKLGVRATLRKPFDRGEVLSAVETALSA